MASLPTNVPVLMLLVLTSSVLASTNYTNTYYITAGNGNGSLDQYLINNVHGDLFSHSSTRLVLSPGVHEVSTMFSSSIFSDSIFTRHVNNIALIGSDGMTVKTLHYDDGQTAEIWEPETVIHCVGRNVRPRDYGFIFYNVNNLTVKNITFRGCGTSTPFFFEMAKYIPRGTYNVNSALAFVSVTNLYLGNILVEDTVIRYDLILLNIWGHSIIENVHVLWQNRNPQDDRLHNFLDLSIESVGGNMIVAYKDYYRCQADVVGEQKLEIISLSIFYLLHENITTDYSKGRKGAGLNIVVSSCTFPVRLYINDYKYYAHIVGSTDWKANIQQRSHNIFIVIFNTAFNFLISITKFSRIDSISNRQVATIGMSVNREHLDRYKRYFRRCSCPFTQSLARVELKNTELTGPQHIGIQVHIYSNQHLNDNLNHYSHLLLFEDVRLVGVKADYPFVVAQVKRFDLRVVLDNVVIENTSAVSGQCAVVEGVTNITLINNCSFQSNLCTALHNINSDIVFRRNNTFFNNSGRYGGGMLVEGFESNVVLAYNAILTFTKNHASLTGGAIHVSNRERVMYCFIRPLRLVHFATIHFSDNTAEQAGSTLWGADLDKKNCEMVKLDIQDQDNSSSVISSSPQQVCYCSNTSILCATNVNGTQQEIYPGQDFNIQLALAGESEGLVPGQVRAEVLNDSSILLGALQTIQEVGRAECATLTYTLSISKVLNKTKKDILLELSVLDSTGLVSPIIYEYSFLEGTINRAAVNPLRIPVILKPCPLGFQLQQYCTCLQQLLQLIQNASCDINTQTVERRATLWMNASYTGDNTQILAVHQHCPFDYCNHNKLRIDLSSPDQQCANGRAGVLCGGCKTGLSLTLGFPKCTHCSNSFVFLLLAFITAGLALVAFLTVLNLTVSAGTINALILYANIIRALNPIFFPTTTFLSVFVAWLNLDVGMDTCFYDGMDFYSLTWLQFVFPVYIWLLVSVMIITSHYSTTVAKLVSRDAVKVLATLFLLSYAKLLRTILTVLSFTFISYENTNGTTHQTAVWLYDGNVEFAGGKHVPLLLTALGFGVVYIVPFTVLLLFAPFLQTRSHRYAFLKWMNKLMPFLDAYQGPYTKRFRFWPGVLLLVRVVLFVSFAANGLGDPQVNLMFIITVIVGVLTLLWILGTVCKFGILYNETSTNFLEMFYLINMIFLSTWSLLKVESNGSKTQAIISNVLIGLSFCVFTCIVVYHTYKKLKELKFLTKILTRVKERVCPTSKESDISNTAQVTDEHNSTGRSNTGPVPKTVTVVNFSDLRESLLTEH